MTIFAYTRVSTEAQTNGTSLDSQRSQVEGWAQLRELTIDAHFREEGISGSTPLAERPEGGRMTRQLQPGDTVVATKLDRMFRNAQDALNWSQAWREQGIDLVLLDIGTEAVNGNGLAKLLFTVLAAVSDLERETIRTRISEGKAAKRAKGGFLGGKGAPFGYTVKGQGRDSVLVEDPDQQAALNFIHNNPKLSSRKAAEAVKHHFGVVITHATVANIRRRAQDVA